MKWDVSRIEAWCIVFMLRYFYWAINPRFKHIIIACGPLDVLVLVGPRDNGHSRSELRRKGAPDAVRDQRLGAR